MEEVFACFSRLRFSKLEVFGCSFSKLDVDALTGGQGGLMPDFGGGMEEVAIEPEVDEGARAGPRAEELEMFVCFKLTPEFDLWGKFC